MLRKNEPPFAASGPQQNLCRLSKHLTGGLYVFTTWLQTSVRVLA
jgi:hypothetical protein